MLSSLVTTFGLLLALASTADAATYYVSTDGATTNCGTMQNIDTPASSIRAAIECANDSLSNTVLIRGGVYVEDFNHINPVSDYPRGSSWDAPATIKAFAGEAVTLRPTSGADHIAFSPQAGQYGAYYLSWENLIFDYQDTQYFLDSTWRLTGGGVFGGMGFHFGGVNHATHVRFRANTFMPAGATHASGELYEWWFDGNHFQGCGDTSGDHCFYIEGGEILIENNTFSGVTSGGYAVQFYAADAVPTVSITIRNNVVRDFPNGGGLTLRGNTFNRVYNNVFSRISGDAVSLYGGNSGQANGEEIINNTFVDIGNDAIVMGHYAGNSSQFQIRNNIFLNVGAQLVHNGAPSNPPVLTHNLCHNLDAEKCSTGFGESPDNIVADPRLADPADGNFQLCTGPGQPHVSCTDASPAIDVGFDSALVASDLVGIPRPMGAGVDIGAYEAGGLSSNPDCGESADCPGDAPETCDEHQSSCDDAMGGCNAAGGPPGSLLALLGAMLLGTCLRRRWNQASGARR